MFEQKNIWCATLNKIMANMNKQKNMVHLQFKVEPEKISGFPKLFGKGVNIKVMVGSSIRELLCTQIGVPSDYLEKKVQTIFLDQKVVDNVDSAIVKNGSTLALSAAMPGLAGASLRKGGYYSQLRKEISEQTSGTGAPPPYRTRGMITIKLFNTVCRDIGSIFLKYGVWMKKLQ